MPGENGLKKKLKLALESHALPLVSFRQKVISACSAILDERIRDLRDQLNDLSTGAEDDTKSAAGDKHEAARAMMQLEQENISRQLDGFLNEKDELLLLQPAISAVISKGCLIRTNLGIIFLAV